MTRQRPGAGRIILSTLTASLLVLPSIVLASLPQEQQHQYGRLNQAKQPKDGQAGQRPQNRNIDGENGKYLTHTSVDSHRASAIATVAPVSHDAVRAPNPVRSSSKDAGLSSLLHARSLQDWEVEDFLLLATVDGSIHARDRKTGAAKWALNVDKPMVQTIYHRQNKSADDSRPEDDYVWIVEPSRDGDIYIYNRKQNGGLQRLHVTVKKLEELSPYVDSAVVYTADKKTTLFTVDAGTGDIMKGFSAQGPIISNGGKCARKDDLRGPDEECGTSGSLVLGRTEYVVAIQHQETASPICTLIYSEWGPNNRDSDLHSQYSSTMDHKYVYSRHDGSIFALDLAQSDTKKPEYRQKLSSPVVRVFDVARPADADVVSPQLVLLPQPIGPADSAKGYGTLERQEQIFVNQTETGGWYAMSENTYPYVTDGAHKALCYRQDWHDHPVPTDSSQPSQHHEALVGVHSLSTIEENRDSTFMTISGPPAEPINETPNVIIPEAPPAPMTNTIAKSYILGSVVSNATDFLVGLFILLCFTWLLVNQKLIYRLVRSKLEIKRVPGYDQLPGSVPSSPIVTEAPRVDGVSVYLSASSDEMDDERSDGALTPTISRRSTLEPPSNRSRSSTLEVDRGRSRIGPRVRIVEPSPSPGPDGDDGTGALTPGKKKARRGCRGGTKHKKKKNSKADEADGLERAVEEAMQMGKEPGIEPDVLEVETPSGHNPADVSGPIIQIGHLKVQTDVVLGFGSHGTVVYKGSFGGRDVAVKRMLLEFYDIASHEVGLLQESDDHPNVIRYFDKESAGDFLYIALELCPASLQDVIEKPANYPSLIGTTGLDLPDVLRQITAGLRYLHSLKIVHRDIKPPNILVSAPKKLPRHPDMFQPPRLLISDFGLCKKLDGDQSSFRATTAHAAGTSGWRAPELLVDDDTLSTDAHSSSTIIPPSTNSNSNSEPLVLDPQTNRRATRAIDIFSLGCVFYYVLTGGNHPFDRDGKYMREANIVKGHYSLDDLSVLGDYQWEAKDLVARMLAHNPKLRPDAAQVLAHPFFWSAEERLEFLCHVSDQFEFEPRDPPSAPLQLLESHAESILDDCGQDFLRALPREFRDTLGKQRKYQGHRLLDLLRALRNKKNHYEDMPDSIKEKVGKLPDGYLGFWTRRFPGLLMGCHEVIEECNWASKDRFKRFYFAI